jgi:arylsulfatase A-like enzyme
MQWPGVIEPGAVCEARVQNIDVAPTIFEIAGASPPDSMPLDGKSWVPLLTGEVEQLHDDLFFEFGYARAVFAGPWTYIALRYPQPLIDAMASGELDEAPNHINQRLQGQMNVAIETYPAYFDPDQLFNVEDDPNEQHNLADDPAYADVLAEMKVRLQRYLDTFEHPFDLEVPEFMRTERYRELCEATRQIGTDYLYWWPKDRWWEDEESDAC